MEGRNNPAVEHDEEKASPGASYWANLVLEKAISSEILARAAQLAYYLLFALFPTLIFIAIVLSFQPLPHLFDDLLDYFQRVLPPQSFKLVKSTLEASAGARPHELFGLSLIIVIWAASSGMEALITALNVAYEARSSRGLLKERLLAILLTLCLGGLTLVALSMLFFGGTIGNRISRAYGFGETFEAIWGLARWAISAGCLLFGLDLLYYFAPNVEQKWKWITPGAVIAILFWFAISITLRFYVARISDYSAIYGALGGVMVLMLWLYFTSLSILLGGVINGTLNHVKRDG
jgi:membrane protein